MVKIYFIIACNQSIKNISIESFEIIVVDNNSNDGSTETVKIDFPKINLINLKI